MSNPVATDELMDDISLRVQLSAACERWCITELAVFGSAVRGELRPDSDIDVLVTFAEDARPSLFDLNHVSRDLERIFSRPVDVVTRRGIESSRHSARRDEILSTARRICGAA
jgi:uncharacterized protein